MEKWRRRRDSNPRYPCGVCSFSKRVPSASRPRLRWMLYARWPGALTSRRSALSRSFCGGEAVAGWGAGPRQPDRDRKADEATGQPRRHWLYRAHQQGRGFRIPGAQIAQLVEHATENRSVAGSIPALGTILFLIIDGRRTPVPGPHHRDGPRLIRRPATRPSASACRARRFRR